MSSKEVYLSKSGVRFYGSLDWRLLDASEKSDASVRSTAKDRGATHFVMCDSAVAESIKVGKKVVEKRRQSAGFFISPNDEVPIKKSHSLAAAFALWSAEHSRAAMCAELTGSRFCVVMVINGMPVQDRVFATIEEAVEVVNGYSGDGATTVFSNNLVRFPMAFDVEDMLGSIAGACNKTTMIRAVPVDVVTIGIALIVVMAVVGGYYGYDKYKKEQARKAAALKAAAEDPVPKYLAALSIQRSSLGFDRPSMVASFNAAKLLPLSATGWNLRFVTCGRNAEQAEGCSTKFERTSGTYKEIKAAFPQLKLSNPPTSVDLSLANMNWAPVFTPTPVSPELVSFDEFMRGMSGSQLQIWTLAGINLKVQPPLLWPSVPGVPGNFQHPQAIAVGDFSLTGISLPIAVEAMNTAPPNVIWKSWKADVEAPKKGSNPLDSAKVTLNGSYYVKN